MLGKRRPFCLGLNMLNGVDHTDGYGFCNFINICVKKSKFTLNTKGHPLILAMQVQVHASDARQCQHIWADPSYISR